MLPHINATTKNVNEIVQIITSKTKSNVNVALVAYRDYSCEKNRYVLPFTTNADKVIEFMKDKCR